MYTLNQNANLIKSIAQGQSSKGMKESPTNQKDEKNKSQQQVGMRPSDVQINEKYKQLNK